MTVFDFKTIIEWSEQLDSMSSFYKCKSILKSVCTIKIQQFLLLQLNNIFATLLTQ